MEKENAENLVNVKLQQAAFFFFIYVFCFVLFYFIYFSFFFFQRKDNISYKPFAKQTIYMKCHVLFPPKNNKIAKFWLRAL